MGAQDTAAATATLTGAEIIAQRLKDYGVRHVFGIVSIHNMPIFDAINRLGYTDIVDSRHECAAAHAADGYARASGELGVVVASTGPGTTNTVTGLYEAAYASSRVLLITGQAETRYYGKAAGYVHEAENQVPMLATVVRRVESPRTASQIGPLLDAIVADMSDGRWQPGALEVPIDLQYAAAPADVAAQPAVGRSPVPTATLARAVDALRGARRRVLLIGGGAMGASAEVTALAEKLEAPVLTSANGRGAVSEKHPLCIGNFFQSVEMAHAIADADVTLAIGTRFQVGVDGRNAGVQPPGKLIHIDIDPAVLGRVHPAAVEVPCDAGQAVTELLELLADADPNDAQFNAAVLTAGEGVRGGMHERLGPDFQGILAALESALPDDGVLVRDSTVAAYFMANQLLPLTRPRCSISPTSGAIGPGLPLGVGAATATGKRTIVIHGDGGFMFHATELATAAQRKLPMTICVFNDGGYGILRWLQSNRFDGRINETDLGFMDFAAMAHSMGCAGERVRSVSEFRSALQTAETTAGPYLIDVDLRGLDLIGGMILPEELGDTALS